jgi:hypothetical protein
MLRFELERAEPFEWRARAPGSFDPAQPATDPAAQRAVAEAAAATDAGRLGALARDERPAVRAAVARNASTPPAVLLELSLRHPDDVAANPYLPLAALEDPAWLDKLGIACLDAALRADVFPEPAALLAQLARSTSEHARAAAAPHPRLPRPQLDALRADPVPVVRAAAAENPALTRDECAALLRDPHVLVRFTALRHPSVPADVLRANASHTDAPMRGAVAANPATPPDVLADLARDAVEAVRAEVAANPASPPDALLALAADRACVREALLANPRLPAELRALLVPTHGP